jgi:hypothetical protein
MWFLAMLDYFERNSVEVERLASEIIELSTRQHFEHFLALGMIYRGWARSASDDATEGISWIEDGIRDYRAGGSVLMVPLGLAIKAEATRAECPVAERAGDSWGSCRFLGLTLRAEIRIPAAESVLPLFVKHPGSYLQEKMCSTLAPSHLLFLHHPFAHDLIDSRLDETRSDLFSVAIAFPVIGHEFPVTLDVGM